MNKHDCLNYHIIKQKTRKTCNIFHKVFFPPPPPPRKQHLLQYNGCTASVLKLTTTSCKYLHTCRFLLNIRIKSLQ